MEKQSFFSSGAKGLLSILMLISGMVFVAELLLMVLIARLEWPLGRAMALDAVLLVLFLFPSLYLLVFRPQIKEIEKNKAMRLKVEASQQMFLTVLDSLDAIVYVADLKTHELIFLNKFARNIFGDVIGQPCWQALQVGQSGPCEFCSNKELVLESGEIKGMYAWEFQNTVNNRWYDVRDRAIRWVDGRLVRLEIATDITGKKTSELEREALIRKLEKALQEVKTLRGIIPICSFCKQIRDDEGYWNQVEVYIARRSNADFSHGVCPACARKHYGVELQNIRKSEKIDDQ